MQKCYINVYKPLCDLRCAIQERGISPFLGGAGLIKGFSRPKKPWEDLGKPLPTSNKEKEQLWYRVP
jgi:hypothetical protein